MHTAAPWFPLFHYDRESGDIPHRIPQRAGQHPAALIGQRQAFPPHHLVAGFPQKMLAAGKNASDHDDIRVEDIRQEAQAPPQLLTAQPVDRPAEGIPAVRQLGR